ncbi:MAG: RNHCP domain-containing protein [Candidatus Staskawiczbacteria bacterium]|nr:RNHCP domain-containing protein [Candidatus Staskawiczbacteria bacterium]
MSLRFIRRRENFRCENCGTEVVGDGYTNHCSACLYSKHVDVNPGDRMHNCKGLMEPISIEQKKGGYIIVHRCTKCGTEKRNRVAKNDSIDAVMAVASAFARQAREVGP